MKSYLNRTSIEAFDITAPSSGVVEKLQALGTDGVLRQVVYGSCRIGYVSLKNNDGEEVQVIVRRGQ